jgi:hypothetical protein
VRIAAIRRVCPLRLILRHWCAAFCAAFGCRATCRLGEVIVGRLEVVLAGNVFAVAQPIANNVRGELLGQFRLPGTPQVVEQAGRGVTPAR